MDRLRLAGTLLLAAAAVAAAGQVTKTPKGYVFRGRYVPNQTTHYSSLVRTRISDQDISVRTKIKMMVTGVKGHVATIRIFQSQPTSGDKDRPIWSSVESTLKLDPLNHPIGSKSNTSLVVPFPEGPIKPGAEWSGMSTFAFGGRSGGLLETRYRFSGIKQDKGKRLATLDAQMRGFATGSGAILIDCTDGSVAVSFMTLQIQTGPGEQYPVQLQIRKTDGH